MNAIQPSTPHLTPVQTRRRVVPRTKNQQRRHPYRGIAAETTAKLAVNLVISLVAVSALVKLLPYKELQQEKLREIRAEVKQTEERVIVLLEDFTRYFDSQQAKKIMQEESYRVDPTQIQIILKEQDPSSAKDPNEVP